ncbi:MAG: hypothetical protein MUF45_12320 [Spirosomaceae bacterium]|jgi:hypothetical protein|nr:hypothetical protein [Spirosomataceae bacterium]
MMRKYSKNLGKSTKPYTFEQYNAQSAFFILQKRLATDMTRFLFLILVSIQVFAQDSSKTTKPKTYTIKQLAGEWVKEEIRMKDGSKLYNNPLNESSLRYIFQSEDSVKIVYDGRSGNVPFTLNGNKLVINSLPLIINYLDENRLILDEDKDTLGIQIRLVSAKIHNLGFTPQTYITQGNDTIYVAERNYLEPSFRNPANGPMEVISQNFTYPEYRTDDFFARFIVTNTGEVKGIKILKSTNEKFNTRLVKAIKKTEGMWEPATWEGRRVNVEMKMRFDMGWSQKMAARNPKNIDSTQIKIDLSDNYLMEGNYYAENKNYKQALRSYNLSIQNNPLNVEVYYKRAAIFAITKQNDKMCEDLKHLRDLEQKRGTELYQKYCEKKE